MFELQIIQRISWLRTILGYFVRLQLYSRFHSFSSLQKSFTSWKGKLVRHTKTWTCM